MSVRTLRGVRGATSAASDTGDAILTATRELLQALQTHNSFDPGDLVSVFFTTTADLTATFPALAARQLGWTSVPMLGGVEMSVPDAPPRLIRVLLHCYLSVPPEEIVHVYLKDARQLRPDWADRHGAATV